MARILLIDDDAEVRTTLRAMLEHAGHTVVEAQDGVDGLRAMRTTAPDLIITDILMPEKEGIETIQEIRAECPDIKIIAISGGGVTGRHMFLDVAQKLGADSVLEKPVMLRTLVRSVEALLSGRSSDGSPGRKPAP